MNKPDYPAWRERPLWTLLQASCLIAGDDPFVPDPYERYRDWLNGGGLAVEIYSDLKDGIDTGDLEFKSARTGDYHNIRATPGDCVTYVAGRGRKIPRQLADLVGPARPKKDETPDQRRSR